MTLNASSRLTRPSDPALPHPQPVVEAWPERGAAAPDLRSVMRRFATGVCLVATYSDHAGSRRHDAVTVNSLTSLSLDPPLVSVCLSRESMFLADLLSSGKWAVSILDDASRRFAQSCALDRATRTRTVPDLPATPGGYTGALVLDGSSWLECVVWDSFDVGDHILVVGEVVALDDGSNSSALVFLHGRYHAL
jgi:flavin reductase (DIM6/NTAB) family NADH-FMN oxidoreductase RutF